MNKIIFPLKKGMGGPEVGDLQAALLLFLDRGIILKDNEGARKELSDALKLEPLKYSEATLKGVSTFQKERHLLPSGAVDEPTAIAINALLADFGMLGQQSASRVVSGQVKREDGLPFMGALVRAFHETDKSSIRLGEDTTDGDGRYTIRYDMLPEVKTIHLRVTISGEDGKTLQSSDLIQNARMLEVVNLTVPLTGKPAAKRRIEGRIVLEHGLPAENMKLRLYRHDFGSAEKLLGETTTLEDGLYALPFDVGGKAASLEVRAVDASGREIPLSMTMHDLGEEERAQVNLVAPASLQMLASEYQRMTADLMPHVGDIRNLAGARENAKFQDITNLNRKTLWDARLIALATNAARLSGDAQVGLSHEALYGLLRAGLPSEKLQLAQVSVEVVEQALKKVTEAGIVNLSEQQVVDIKKQFQTFSLNTRMAVPAPGSRSTYGELLRTAGLSEDAASTKFATVFLNHRGDGAKLWEKAARAGIAPGDIQTLQLQGKLAFVTRNNEAMTIRLKQKGISDPVKLVEKGFYQAEEWKAEIMMMAGNNEEKLIALIPPSYEAEKFLFNWNKIPGNDNERLVEYLMQKFGIDWVKVARIEKKDGGKTILLSNETNSLSLTLNDEKTKVNLAISDGRTEKFIVKAEKDELNIYAQNIEERLNAYAEDMARRVRLSHPTHVIGHMLENDISDDFKLGTARPAAAALLKNATAKGFRFGQTPVEAFVRDHPEVLSINGIDANAIQTAKQSMKTLQRVYQLAPSNEAMPVLLSLGLTSAYDIVALSQDEFLDRYGHKFPSRKQAILVYRKAQQVSSTTYNLFTIAKKLDSEAPVYGISAPVEVRESVKKSLIKQFPTMESLFGSMDFCECEHCRSVLGPAAYLVDLLQFIDAEPQDWSKFLATWKEKHNGQDYTARYKKPYDALIERRPDLPHIPLTCENTNTALPYIDVVNEILEYYVANGKLEENAACDTGEATTAELLAEPQNVISEAYDELRKASYPLNLPFDLWIETVRQFCNHFETPLSRMLEVFRPGDELFAPAQSFDRASIFMESLGFSSAELSIFTDPLSLNLGKWHELFGYPRGEIGSPNNATNATLTVSNRSADLFNAGDRCRYYDAVTGVLQNEEKEILAKGARESGGQGKATITFIGVWTAPPKVGDILVLANVPELLESAKTLSRRLGVTYKEITEIVKTGFVNPILTGIALIYKLGVTIQDARFYKDHKPFFEQNKDLIEKERSALSPADQQRFDALSNKVANTQKTGWEVVNEVAAFEDRLKELSAAFNKPLDQLQTHIQNIPFDKVLVLADPDAGCNFDLTALQYADGTKADPIAFLRINLFVRLWRKLSWTIEETDRALQAFVPKNTPFDAAHLARSPLKTALIYIAHLKALDEQVRAGKQSRLKLMTLWSDIATTGKNPLYAQLFLTRSLLKSDAVFDDALGQYLSPTGLASMAQSQKYEVRLENIAPADRIDPAPFTVQPKVTLFYDALQEVQHLTYEGVLTEADKAQIIALSPSPALIKLLDAVQVKAREFTHIKGHLLTLQGALGLTADEISRILTDAGASIDASLSLSNVSVLYRYGLLARGLKLSVYELITLKHLCGLDPFKPLLHDPVAVLEEDYPFTQTLRFVEIAGYVKESGLKIEDLDYLLRHHIDDLAGKYRPDNEAMLALIKTLSEGIRAIRAENAVPDDAASMSEETLRQKLGLALTPDVVERFLAMMNATVEFTATRTLQQAQNPLDPKQFTDEPSIRQISYNDTRKEQKLTYRGVLFDVIKNDLKNKLPKPVPPDPHVPSSIFGDLLDDIQNQALTFFVKNLQKQAPNVQPAGGFLEVADFDLLFAPIPSDSIEAQQRVRQQRTRLAQTFLPFLQQRLIRQFIVHTLTAQTGADQVLVESLLTDSRMLGETQPAGSSLPLMAAFTAAGERGLTATFFASPDESGAALGILTFDDTDTGLKDNRGNLLRPAGANSAQFEGYLEVPSSGAYRFYILLDKKNAKAKLRFYHLPDPLFLSSAAANDGSQASEYLELEPGVPYRFMLELQNLNGGEARLLVQGETLPKDSLAQLALYPLTAIERSERALVLLSKALLLTQSLNLNEREIRYMLTNASDFDNLNLGKLPTQESDDSPAGAIALFLQFLRLSGYARLKRDLAGGMDDLIKVFEANKAGDIAKVYQLIAKLTRRNEGTVKAAANALSVAPAFASELAVQRMWEALQIVERFGVSIASIAGWTRIVNAAAPPDQRFAIARDLKEAIKARFEPETWQRVAQPIFDRLRKRQRDSLAAHVMHRQGFASMEQLYEYFLIDPGMEPVVQTSRIRLAIASVQLFIQRCLLNMESQVNPSVINARQWEWMKRYRVWEANRKIFLFPENWLEPEFRDDKTHLFSELEGTLLQGDVSSDLVEDAFLNYLKKLEELARLDIVAMHLEDKADPALNTLHVIGRTYSEPHKYFYRRYVRRSWTPWEPVTAEIEGDHIAPVVWRDRLYLFWVTFMDKVDENARPGYRTKTLVQANLSDMMSDMKEAGMKKKIEAQLHWSEYLQGEWSTRESGGITVSLATPCPVTINFDNRSIFIHVSKEPYENGDERGVYIHLGGPISQAFYLAGRNSVPEKVNYSSKPGNPYSSANTEHANRYEGSGPLKVAFAGRITTEDGKSPVQSPKETPSILEQGGGYTLLPCDNNIKIGAPDFTSLDSSDPGIIKAIENGLPEIASLMKPIFYMDNAHTFFIEPDVAERTIEEWQEWVTRTPQPEPDWGRPEWWKDIVVIPAIPKTKMSIDQGELTKSVINMKPGQDWLANPGTGLLFDNELIAPFGRVEVTMVPSILVAEVLGECGIPINVLAGSGIAPDKTLVAKANDTLDRAGLIQVAGGLNVIGSGGFNTVLAKNFDTINRSASAGKLGGRLTRSKER